MFHYDMRTKLKKSQHTIKWTIEKFTDLMLKNQEGPAFEINCDKWYLELRSKHTDICLRLYRSSLDYHTHVNYQVTLTDSEGVMISEKSGKTEYDQTDTEWNTYKELLQWNTDLFQDTVTVCTILEFCCLQTNVYDRCVNADFEEQVVKSLSEGVLALHDNKDDIHKDFYLRVNEEKLHVHRFILCARSPVFREMLQKDPEMCSYIINDFNLSVLKVMVDYMYSRVHFNLDFDTCCSLYQAAEKYQLRDMRDLYRTILFRELEPIHAGRLLQLADRYQDLDLKAAVLEFIRSNYIGCLKGNFYEAVGGKESDLYKEVLRYLDVENY